MKRILIPLLLLLSLADSAAAGEPRQILATETLPYGREAIGYFDQADDAVAALVSQFDAGKLTLEHDAQHGYLRSVLETLQIPLESQLLVFSKTSVNHRLIGPQSPRAIYFNDEVSVAWVPTAAALEVAAADPRRGTIFYTMSQEPAGGAPRIRRESRCLACHAGSSALGVPGNMVRSFLTGQRGEPLHGFSRITHATPLAKRWGGWYVTGTHGGTHLGNLVGRAEADRHKKEPSFGGNVTDLQPRFDASAYPTEHSDLVAHLIFEHQMHFYNLVTRVNYESRLGLPPTAEEELLRYLLFADEAPLEGPVRGTSGYAEVYQRLGPRDARGRSLRELDLQTRLFQRRLSPLIYSRAFVQLPQSPRQRLWTRLQRILAGEETSGEFAYLEAQERREILAILEDTVPPELSELPTK